MRVLIRNLLFFTLLFSVIYLFIQVISLQKDNKLLFNQNKYILKHLSGGVENIPKAYGNLRKRQEQLLNALVHFDKFASEHGIEYWLDFGTLLGAHRHQGFIPWDDDIDISMTDDNLAKMRELAKDPKYKMTLTPKAKDSTDGDLWFFQNETGVVFDIFAYAITDKKGLDKQIDYINWIRNFKLIVPDWENKILRKYNEISVARPENIQNSDLYLVMRTKKKHGIERVTRSNFKASEIFPLTTLNFEGHGFPVPNKHGVFLARRFGDDFLDLPKDFGVFYHSGSWGGQ